MFALSPRVRKISVSLMSEDGSYISEGLSEHGHKRKGEYVDGNLRILEHLECGSEVMCVRFNADGSLLAAGQADGVIRIFNPDTGQLLYSLSDEDTNAKHLPCTSIKFKPFESDYSTEHKNFLVAAYASGLVKFWHITSQTCTQTINENRQTLALSFNPHGSKIITCGADPDIFLYDVETKKNLRVYSPSAANTKFDSRDVMNGHRARVFAIQYHPGRSQQFVSGGWDDTVQFWDERDEHATRRIYGPHICGDALDIDPVHNHILTGSWRKENVLQIWDYDSGSKIKDVPQDPINSSLLYCCQWHGKENIVCGGSDQNIARVIDRGTLNTVGQLVELPQGVYCVDNDRQGLKPRIAVGTAKKVYVLKPEKKA